MDGTITLNSKILYKKRRNPRAFKLWDSEVLTTLMVHASEVKAKLEEASVEKNVPVEELGSITINSELLYLLTEGYQDLYTKLLAENLIKTGNIKSNPNIH